MHNRLMRNDLCWCGSQIKYKKCHAEFDDRIKDYKRQGHIVPPKSIIKTSEQISKIRESGKVNIAVLDYIAENIEAGITTENINELVYKKTIELGGVPAQLHYKGFSKNVCTSVNDQVCHGIPSKNVVLRNGDIINVDVSTNYKGYFSDSSRMFCIGDVDAKKERLVGVVGECIELGLKQVQPWGFLGDMGQAIHEHATNNGYSVVREIGGHGIGLAFHEEPWVSYVSKQKTEMLMVPGMIFTIEPMLNMGTDKIFLDQKNGWTFYTADGQPSAQSEIMVLVTNEGHEILAY
ncbi:methionyl aminopeptidase [Alkaliphilus oremlandii]|uniref:Methionine aminopeptidase n=1 Tax=Alkaliphilus oremlandii (strain OhILAs) TaxID=350688 RepID=A8MKE2_ALKOO|nr:methionyl aminopeptidase [Alkaliphilus oremlandii]ABW20274.1 methionine aminopeptidase, type I [Alkaliphilus oremlandii OhILAs]